MKIQHIQRLTLATVAAIGLAGAAQACQPNYTAQAGDTLFSIAEENLGGMTKWSLLLHSNPSLAGKSLVELPAGMVVKVPCPAGSVVVEDTQLTSATIIDPADVDMRMLTGGNYAPFTGRELPGQGMVTELVNAALERSPSPVTYSISWEDDWSKHLFPMLDGKEFDMGFPWLKPDCDATPGDERCANFLFSEPLMLLPIMLFVKEDNQFRFTTDADVVGRSLCRPAGYFTHDLDRADRKWLTDSKINFVAGDSPKDCFNKVMSGEVDAATVNLFLGANVILEMGLRNQVVPLEKPLSEEGLHVIISKRHWRGTTHLYRVNAGLKKMREEGVYQEIVARHLQLFQSRLQ